jgi:hypothetical protein
MNESFRAEDVVDASRRAFANENTFGYQFSQIADSSWATGRNGLLIYGVGNNSLCLDYGYSFPLTLVQFVLGWRETCRISAAIFVPQDSHID